MPLVHSALPPSAWVERHLGLLRAGGQVLDLACGSGRHLRWLVAQGFVLTGVDRDGDAVRALQDLAEVKVADLEAAPWPMPGRQFDAVVVTNYLWRPLWPDILSALAPGGVLIYETFAHGQQLIGKPSRPEFLLQPGELLRLCAALRVVAFEDGFEPSPARFVQRIVAVNALPGAALVPKYVLPAAGTAAECGEGCGDDAGSGPGAARETRGLDVQANDMKPITGSIVALVTPMFEDGSIDYASLKRLIDWHIDQGTDCIGVVGTTGESPTVSMEENCEVIRVTVAHAAGRVPVMAGTGANSTAEAITLTRYAKQVGASCHLSVVPYYNRPSQEGIYEHFRAIVQAVDLPLVLYNVPGRTVADMGTQTALRLAQLPGVVGIKEATGDIERASELIKRAPAGFSVYSGDDSSAVALMLLGGHGNVSVTANVAPRLMHELCAAALRGDARTAVALHLRLLPLHQKLFCEPSPAPTKWALQRLGLGVAPHVRLPMTVLSAAGQVLVDQALRDSGLLV